MEPKTYSFHKTKDERWWIEYPEWDGDPEELEMVAGADSILEHLDDENSGEVKIQFSDEPFDHDFVLEFDEEMADGGIYILKGPTPFEIWLCRVTYFVFGDYLPQRIYCAKINDNE